MDCHDTDSLHHVFLQVGHLHFHRTFLLLDKVGIYPGQPPMLFALYKKDGQSQKELAKQLNIKPATITVMLTRMEKAGLLERRKDPDDQRVVRVYLTITGRDVCLKVVKVTDGISEECFRDFTQEEKMLLRRLLMQMKENLTKVSSENLHVE